MRNLLIALGLIGAVAACGASPHAKHARVAEVTSPHDSPPPRPSKKLASLPNRHAKLTFDLGALAPLPLVHGTIGGVPTWMIVDSGASTHFVMSWMANRAKVEMRPTTTAVSDHVRHDVNVTLADRSLIAIEGWGGLTPGELLVVDAPASGLGAKNNIGVMLSPQMLDDDRPVIFELDRSSIRTGSEADAVRALAARKVPVNTGDITFCHDVFSVAASIDGHAVRLVVDSGASSTDLFSLSEAGRALASRSASAPSEGEPASGPVAMRVAKGVRIQLGALSMQKDIDILTGAPETECPADGVLGVDVLRSCVLVFGRGKGRLRMQCGQ
jgi:Aspartyl protease